MILARRIDSIFKIYFDSKLAWSSIELGVTSNEQITIDSPDLFGGTSKEGGVSGKVDIMFGGTDQQKNPYLQQVIQKLVPAYRGVVSLVFRAFYFSANSPYFKKPSVLAKYIPMKTWRPEWMDINGGANAAHILLEMTTDPDVGMGWDISRVDLASFESAAQTLYNEGLGLSFATTGDDPFEAIIKTIQEHINGVYFVDPYTGKFTLKLFRGDYLDDLESLTLVTESHCEITKFERPSYAELINQVVLEYHPQGAEKNDSVTVQNLAAIQSQGGVISQSVTLVAIDNADTAAKIAARELRIRSTPLATGQLKANRIFFNKTIGDVFKLSLPTRMGVGQMVCRVVNIDYGSLTDRTITVDFIEDVFGLPVAEYLSAQSSLWTDPVQDPAPFSEFAAFELPYYQYIKTYGESSGRALADTPGIGLLAACVPTPSSFVQEMQLWTPTGSSTDIPPHGQEYPPFDPRLAVDSDAVQTVFSIGEIDAAIFNYLIPGTSTVQIGEEVMTFASITNTSIAVVARTTGDLHAGGSPIILTAGERFGMPAHPIALLYPLSSGATSISAWSAIPYTDYVVPDEYYMIDTEIVKVTSGSQSLGVTIARGQMGTLPAAHTSGSWFRRMYIAHPVFDAYEKSAVSDFAPKAVLRTAMPKAVRSIVNRFSYSGRIAEVRAGSYGVIGSEIVGVVYASGSSLILQRGVLDTVPVDHDADEVIYFCSDAMAISNHHYSASEVAKFKLLSLTGRGLLPLTSATENSITMDSRAARPYPPGNLKFNSVAYPDNITGELTITWSHRDKTLQTAGLIEQSEGNIGPEAGTVYPLKIYGEDDGLLKDTVVSGTSYDFTDELSLSDLWDEARPVATIAEETAESALTGWSCDNEGLSSYRARVFTYDGTDFIAQRQSYAYGPPTAVSNQGFLTSGTSLSWSLVATTGSLDEVFGLSANGTVGVGYSASLGYFTTSDYSTFTAMTLPSGLSGSPGRGMPLWNGTAFVWAAWGGMAGSMLYSSDGSTVSVENSIPDPSDVDFVSPLLIKYQGKLDGKEVLTYSYNRTLNQASSIYTGPDLSSITEKYNTATDPNTLSEITTNVVWNGTLFLTFGLKAGPQVAAITSSTGTSFTSTLDGAGLSFGTSVDKVLALAADGGTFYAIFSGGGNKQCASSTDGVNWTVLGTVATNYPGRSAEVEFFEVHGSRMVASVYDGTVDWRMVYESVDGGATWAISYPQPPFLTRDSGDFADGIYSMELHEPSAVPGTCKKDFSTGFDYVGGKVILSGIMKASTGQKPTAFATDIAASVEKGYGVQFNSADGKVYVLSYVGGAVSVVWSAPAAFGTDWARFTLSVTRNCKFSLLVEALDTTVLLEENDHAFTGVAMGTRAESGKLRLFNQGHYDDIRGEFQPQYPRYNSSLRVELGSRIDVMDSWQNHVVTVTRAVTSTGP